MKRVMLVNLPGESLRKPEEHCGLAFLKSYLEESGIGVDILDAYALRKDISWCKEYVLKWENQYQCYDKWIGISPFVTSHENFVELGEFINATNQNITIFAGGHFATLNKEYLISTYQWLDAIIVGEGELSTCEYIKYENENTPGVYQRGQEERFATRDRISNLDTLPFQSRYLTPEELEGQPFAITTSRGCYGECSFCSISTFYKTNTATIKQSFRSAANVSEEIHRLHTQYGIDALKIVDDNFFRNSDNGFLEELVERLSDLKISFRLSARPNDITEQRACLLAKMGAVVVGIGAESAHKESLQLFNKGIDIKESDKAIIYLSTNGITCLANFIMFNPIIDIAGVEENCEFVQRHMHECLFHRINSHLWIRSTDPIVKKLVELRICEANGFPYVECKYLNGSVVRVRKLFDDWCDSNMQEYYALADVLMAKGIRGNEEIYAKYKKMLKKDIEVLQHLLLLSRKGSLNIVGESYISRIKEGLQ